MPSRDETDATDELSPRERARLRHRDRKRTTPMVMDNAGVRRTAQALANRRASRPAEAPSPDPG